METPIAEDAKAKENRTFTHAIYGLYAASLLLGGITAIVAIVLNYIKKEDVSGTILESHFQWQIRTFWWSLLWGFIGMITFIIVIDMFVLAADVIWFIYRIAKGWLRLHEGKPMYSQIPNPPSVA